MDLKNTPYTNVDEYLALVSPEVRAILTDIRNTIREVVPEATEKIAYQMPAYDLYGPLVYFAAFRDHIGFFPTPSGVEAFKEELHDYKLSKGTIQFPLNRPIPYELIKRITIFRAEENRRNHDAKKIGKASDN